MVVKPSDFKTSLKTRNKKKDLTISIGEVQYKVQCRIINSQTCLKRQQVLNKKVRVPYGNPTQKSMRFVYLIKHINLMNFIIKG
jgi:hypothetical protein